MPPVLRTERIEHTPATAGGCCARGQRRAELRHRPMCMAECPSARKTPKAGKLSGPARARIISLRRFSFSGQNELPRYCPDKGPCEKPATSRTERQDRNGLSRPIGRRRWSITIEALRLLSSCQEITDRAMDTWILPTRL